jgi:hypothetical protein
MTIHYGPRRLVHYVTTPSGLIIRGRVMYDERGEPSEGLVNDWNIHNDHAEDGDQGDHLDDRGANADAALEYARGDE